MKRILTTLAALALSVCISGSAGAQSLPFSFGGPSSLARGPDRLTFGLIAPFCEACRAVAGSGGPEDILVDNALGFLLAATWLGGAAASSSSAPVLAYSLGVEHQSSSVVAFRQSGVDHPTTGDSSFTGIFVGVAYETPLGGGYSSSSIAVPTLGLGLNLGYGWAAVDGFSGSFQADGNGLYGRADAYLAIPLAGGILLTPGLSYRLFDFGGIEDRGFGGFIRLVIPL